MFRLFLGDKNDENCFLDSVVPERVRSDKNRNRDAFLYFVVVPMIMRVSCFYFEPEHGDGALDEGCGAALGAVGGD